MMGRKILQEYRHWTLLINCWTGHEKELHTKTLMLSVLLNVCKTIASEFLGNKVVCHESFYSFFANNNKLDPQKTLFIFDCWWMFCGKRKAMEAMYKRQKYWHQKWIPVAKSKLADYDKTLWIICQQPQAICAKLNSNRLARQCYL